MSLCALWGLLSNASGGVFNSPELNYFVRALLDVNTPVDVDQDGEDDLFFYGDLSLVISSGGRIDPLQLKLRTAENVYVSCFNIPFPSPSEGGFIWVPLFSTLVDGSRISSSLASEFDLLSWETGELSFHGFEIAGGIPSYDSYLGVKIIKNGQEYYGWVRLIFPVSYDYFDETSYVKIKETAFESVEGTPIIAGVGKVDFAVNYPSQITQTAASSLNVEVMGVASMMCLFQESVDLQDWETLSVDYSVHETLSKSVSVGDTPKFYRWQITENLEVVE